MFVLIITIPFGVQSFKLASYTLWPFGRVVVAREDAGAITSLIGNVIWFLFAGLWMAIGHVITACFLAITIIGIPFAIAHLKLARVERVAVRILDRAGIDGRLIQRRHRGTASGVELRRRASTCVRLS